MSLQPSEAPKPLPSIPCPTFDGHRVKWEPWKAATAVTHIDPSCGACAFPGPLSVSFGVGQPNPGEMWDVPVPRTLPSGRTCLRDVKIPAHPVLRLWAILCPSCYSLDVIALGGRENWEWENTPTILCDGCDRFSAAGATLEEARSNLVALGGWTAAETDWDLCPACNPASPEPTSIRAAAAVRASRGSAG